MRDLDLGELVGGVAHHRLVADRAHRLGEDRPHRLRGQDDAGLALALDVDAFLLRHRPADQQGAGRAILVLADPDRDLRGLVEPVGLERLRGVVDELHRLRALELVEELGDQVRVGPQRARLDDPPLAGLVGDHPDLVAVDVEVDAAHVAPVEGDDGAVAEVGERPGRIARDALREGDDRRLAALAGVDPHAGRVLATHPQHERLGPAPEARARSPPAWPDWDRFRGPCARWRGRSPCRRPPRDRPAS